MPDRARRVPVTEGDVWRDEFGKLRKELRALKAAQQTPTQPVYGDEFPLDAVEGQFAVKDGTAWFYFGGAWHPMAGARIVRGGIYNDANIIEGTGFSAEWNDEDMSAPGENLITIRFDASFAEPGPIVALTPNNNNPADVEGEYVVTLKTRDPDFIVVEGKELDGTANIGGFDFLAIEAET